MNIICITLEDFLNTVEGLTHRNIQFSARVDDGRYVIAITGF
jgi:hypothetical protein